MRGAVLFLACGLIAGCSDHSGHAQKVWGGMAIPTYEQDYNRKADAKLIRSKEIDSGSDCIGQNLDGICHGTVMPNE